MSEVTPLRAFLHRYPRLVVVTGAGCSTESGIGDYRDSLGRWKHSQPVLYADFMASLQVRAGLIESAVRPAALKLNVRFYRSSS